MVTDDNDTPGVIAPPPLIAMGAIVLGLTLDWLLPLRALTRLISFWPRLSLGVALVVAGGALALAAERTFKRVGTNVPPWKPALALATGGIFARLRNPMYVGVAIMLIGLGLALASDWILLLVLPTALLLHYGVVLREERYLEIKFGDDYRRYKSKVRRYGIW
jgi:protein-S-isoprenylcysteine O-methyltransferase Ste14